MIEDNTGSTVAVEFPHIYRDPSTLPTSLDPFTITTSTGFLPFQHPRIGLPGTFAILQKLLDEISIIKIDGTPGLLAKYKLGETIDGGALPDLTTDIDSLLDPNGNLDMHAVTAVFRDYSFLASAYLLEPCYQSYNVNADGYDLGRNKLPKEIAGPLVKTADMYAVVTHPFIMILTAFSDLTFLPSCLTPRHTLCTTIVSRSLQKVLMRTRTCV